MFNKGKVTFPTDIVGLIVLKAGLDATDAGLGEANTTYPDPNAPTVPGSPNDNLRGLELSATQDKFTLFRDMRTLEVDLNTNIAADQVRVLTAAQSLLLAESTFENGTEDWTVTGGSAPTDPVQEPAGGNPGGRLAAGASSSRHRLRS